MLTFFRLFRNGNVDRKYLILFISFISYLAPIPFFRLIRLFRKRDSVTWDAFWTLPAIYGVTK